MTINKESCYFDIELDIRPVTETTGFLADNLFGRLSVERSIEGTLENGCTEEKTLDPYSLESCLWRETETNFNYCSLEHRK